MVEITAAAVKALRDRTQLPMMKCKQALTETGGDEQAAVELLRKEGAKFSETRGDRETSCGRIEIYADMDSPNGAIVELLCESDPVAKNDDFRQLATDIVQQLATGPGADSPEALLAQKSPSDASMTLQEQLNDVTNRIREVMRLKRIERVSGRCGGYVHHTSTTGVLVTVEGGNAEAAKDVAMHIAAMRPDVVAIEDLDPAAIEKEREILTEASRREGKPENIIEKMVEGRLRNFYAERVLNEQPFVKDDKTTVGKFAKSADMKILSFQLWELGRE